MEPTRVTRRIRAGMPGTLKLARRHGDALLCVRYRENLQGNVRYTTVELVVDRRPVRAQQVEVNVNWEEHALRATLKQLGAQWDSTRRVWVMDWSIANQLQLMSRAKAVHRKRAP